MAEVCITFSTYGCIGDFLSRFSGNMVTGLDCLNLLQYLGNWNDFKHRLYFWSGLRRYYKQF
jgi:hypothetical protein